MISIELIVFSFQLSDFIDQVPRFPHLRDVTLARQPISLKSLTDITGSSLKAGNFMESHKDLPNGILNVVHTNGDSGIV